MPKKQQYKRMLEIALENIDLQERVFQMEDTIEDQERQLNRLHDKMVKQNLQQDMPVDQIQAVNAMEQIALFYQGRANKFDTIKAVRLLCKISLKESKDLVERLEPTPA